MLSEGDLESPSVPILFVGRAEVLAVFKSLLGLKFKLFATPFLAAAVTDDYPVAPTNLYC